MPFHAAALNASVGQRGRAVTVLSLRLAKWPLLAAFLLVGLLIVPVGVRAAPIEVRQAEGVVHGFLVLRSLDGKALADGDLIQTAKGDLVTTRLVFHFRDGSIHDEAVVYSQRGTFRFIRDHLVQKGRTFPQPMDVVIDGANGQATVRSTDSSGKAVLFTEKFELPSDIANGLILTLLKNIPSGAQSLTWSMVVAAPKPRLVKLIVTPQGEDAFSIGSSTRRAVHYEVKVELGGLVGLIAPLVGKQPPPTQVWILGGEAPAFVKMEGPLFAGGPIWRIEIAKPAWP
jgi:hypothetical protein